MTIEKEYTDFIITDWVTTIDSKEKESVTGVTTSFKNDWPYDGTEQTFEIDKFWTTDGVLYAKSGSAVLELK